MENIKRKKGSTSVDAFTDGKLVLVNNTLLYYNFLCQDGEVVEVNNLTLCDKDDFRKWKSDCYLLSTSALNTTRTGDTVNAANFTLNTSNTAVPTSTKGKEHAWLSWRLSNQDIINTLS